MDYYYEHFSFFPVWAGSPFMKAPEWLLYKKDVHFTKTQLFIIQNFQLLKILGMVNPGKTVNYNYSSPSSHTEKPIRY